MTREPTAAEQAFLNTYCRRVISELRQAADLAEADLEAGTPILEVWKILQAPLVNVLADQIHAKVRGRD